MEFFFPVQLGMGEMFKQNSDWSGLFEKKKDLRVSKAVHKAVIEVNEDGSEASAATGNANKKQLLAVNFIHKKKTKQFFFDSNILKG